MKESMRKVKSTAYHLVYIIPPASIVVIFAKAFLG